MKKIELKVVDIIERIPSFPGLFLLLLKEKKGERKLPIVIGLSEAQAIAFRLNRVQSKRPFTHDLFVSFAQTFAIVLKEVLIYHVEGGTYCSYLICEEENGHVRQVDARTSDAVAIALRAGCPIYTFDTLLDQHGMDDETKGMVQVPLSSLDTEWLQEALKKAVKEENYEWASHLRDEIKKRGENEL